MKNLFFYGNIQLDDMTSGITKKVTAQINTLKKTGFNVFFTGYTENGVAIFNNSKAIKEVCYDTKSIKFRVLRRWHLLKLSREFIKQGDIRFEFGYLRFHYFDSYYVKLLKALKNKNIKVIVEAHSYPYRISFFNKLLPIYLIDYIYEPIARKYIDLVAAISNESNIWNRPTVNIDNAIDIKSIPIQEKEPSKNNEIRFISVTNERKYHGFSKVIDGLETYYQTSGKENIQIYFVGNYLSETKNRVSAKGLENRIHFVGKKMGNELIDIYNKSDIGIGALGFRGNTEYGSTIKTKEYFAVGLPFVNGWKEYSFDDSYPYVKRIKVEEDGINFHEIIKFYNTIKDDSELQVNMRNFAKDNFTWEAQLKKIFDSI